MRPRLRPRAPPRLGRWPPVPDQPQAPRPGLARSGSPALPRSFPGPIRPPSSPPARAGPVQAKGWSDSLHPLACTLEQRAASGAQTRVTFRALKVPVPSLSVVKPGLPAQHHVHPAPLPGAEGGEGVAAQGPGLLGGEPGHGDDLLHAEQAEGFHVQVGQAAPPPARPGLRAAGTAGRPGPGPCWRPASAASGPGEHQPVGEQRLVPGGLEGRRHLEAQLRGTSGPPARGPVPAEARTCAWVPPQATTGWGL